MGFFSDIKKLLFGAKAVTKSQSEKAIEYGKEAGSDFLDKSGDILGKAADTASDFGSSTFDKVKDSATDIGGSVLDKSGEFLGKAKDVAGDVFDKAKDVASNTYDSLAENETVNKAGDMAENVGGVILDKGSDLANKAGSVAENLGGKILDTGGDLLDKGADLSENVGGKIMDAASAGLDRVKETGENMMNKMNDLVDKANEEAAKESLDDTIDEAKSWDEKLADHIKGDDVMNQKDPKIGYENLDKSMLDGKDDFFSKAAKYADGNYSGKEEPKVEDTSTNDIFANTEEHQKQLDAAKEKEPFKGEIKGFTDNDGDGDPLIDDAILDDDDSDD